VAARVAPETRIASPPAAIFVKPWRSTSMSGEHLLREAIVRLKELENPSDIGDVLPIICELADRMTVLGHPAIRGIFYEPAEENKPLFDAFQADAGGECRRIIAIQILDPFAINSYETFYYLAFLTNGETYFPLTLKHCRRMAVLLERLQRLGGKETENNTQGAIPETNGQTDNSADTKPKKTAFVPRDRDVLRLAKKTEDEKGKGRTQIDIAIEFTGGDENRAKSLLRAVRRFRKNSQ
jgi:hypothetical protein